MPKKKLKKYQKKKFEYYKNINEVVYNDNEAYIILKIDKLSRIISDYSMPGEEILNQYFLNIIEKKASFVSQDYPLVLQIYSDCLNSEEKILIRKLLKNYFELEKTNKIIEIKELRRKSRFFFTIGIIGFIASIALLYLNLNFLIGIREIISFLGSFSIWEFFELRIFEEDSLQEQILKYEHLSKIRVVFDKI